MAKRVKVRRSKKKPSTSAGNPCCPVVFTNCFDKKTGPAVDDGYGNLVAPTVRRCTIRMGKKRMNVKASDMDSKLKGIRDAMAAKRCLMVEKSIGKL